MLTTPGNALYDYLAGFKELVGKPDDSYFRDWYTLHERLAWILRFPSKRTANKTQLRYRHILYSLGLPGLRKLEMVCRRPKRGHFGRFDETGQSKQNILSSLILNWIEFGFDIDCSVLCDDAATLLAPRSLQGHP